MSQDLTPKLDDAEKIKELFNFPTDDKISLAEIGFKHYRFKDNQMELAVANNFNHYFSIPKIGSDRGVIQDPFRKLQLVFGQDYSRGTPRDLGVINSTIQWLGSPVGRNFLMDLARNEPQWKDFFKEIST